MIHFALLKICSTPDFNKINITLMMMWRSWVHNSEGRDKFILEAKNYFLFETALLRSVFKWVHYCMISVDTSLAVASFLWGWSSSRLSFFCTWWYGLLEIKAKGTRPILCNEKEKKLRFRLKLGRLGCVITHMYRRKKKKNESTTVTFIISSLKRHYCDSTLLTAHWPTVITRTLVKPCLW